MDLRFTRLKLDAQAIFPEREWLREAESPSDLFKEPTDVFILDGNAPDLALRTVEAIRKNPRTFAVPVFFSIKQSSRASDLGDGLIASLEDAASAVRPILNALTELDKEAPLSEPSFRLLTWLYTRRDRELLPVSDPTTPTVYGYPVAECLADDGRDPYLWLQEMRDQGQLTQGRLIARIRTCFQCGSPHLNFMDVCPECRSLEISSKELIHCFTCGRISAMEDLLQEEGLFCPHCKTRLRHLGSDYDHPLESMICSACKSHFVEAQVVASCYACGAVNNPGDLTPRVFHSWRITDKGRISARIGRMEVEYALFDRLGNVAFSYFEQFLGWSVHYARRYPDQTFTVLVLRFVNLERIADALGNHRMSQLLDSIATRLKELLRLTDVTSRSALGTLWFLLPHTSRQQSAIVLKRFESLRELVAIEDAPRLEMRIAHRSFPDDFRQEGRDKRIGAKELLFELNAQLEQDG